MGMDSYDGEPFDSKPKMVNVSRTTESLDEEKIEIEIEIENKRIETLRKMKQAIECADKENFVEAKKGLEQAQNLLEQARNLRDGLNYPIIEALKSQLKQLINLMEPDLYRSKGHHIALSTLTSHYRQREAITNDELTKSSLFATQAMVEFAKNVQGLDDEQSDKISKLVDSFKTLIVAPKTKE